MSNELIQAADWLAEKVDQLSFSPPTTHVYNPLKYAAGVHHQYLERFDIRRVQTLWLGMNPGPWGMAQTGVPFGEVTAVRDYLNITGPVGQPTQPHPKRPVEGFDCPKSEVSGRRLWGLMQERYPSVDEFFQREIVFNYCPLIFMESSARNRTPDKLPASEREPLTELCDAHLARMLNAIDPVHVIGVGVYAEKCLQRVVKATGSTARVCRVLHPSPASPAANKDWSGKVTRSLQEAGVWV